MIWSAVLSVWSLMTMFLVGRKLRWGWMWGLAGQCLWAIYAVLTEQYGFFLSIPFFSGLYVYNFWRWGKQAAPGFRPMNWAFFDCRVCGRINSVRVGGKRRD